MPQTNDGSVVTDYAIDLLELKKGIIGLRDIHYGDLRIIGSVPTICVEPARTLTEYSETGLQVTNQFDIGFIIYHTGTTGVEGTQRKADDITTKVRDELNKDARPVLQGGTQFGGLLMDGLVTSIEYGYRILADEAMRANRIIFTGKTRTDLVIP